MKIGLQKQSVAELLRSVIEAWRHAGQMSREAVAIHVTEAHELIGADAATGITFDSTSKDMYTRAKSAAQKLYRWLGGDDDHEAKLPANMLPSILAALPMEQRLAFLNQVLCPLGIESRAIDGACAAGLDVSKHLYAVMKEAGEAQMALVTLPPTATEADLLEAHRQVVEAEQACSGAAKGLLAEIATRQTLARLSDESK